MTIVPLSDPLLLIMSVRVRGCVLLRKSVRNTHCKYIKLEPTLTMY